MIFSTLSGFIQKYPAAYDCIAIGTACVVCIAADFAVKKILLRGLKQIFNRLSDDSSEQSLLLKMASRLANIVPVVILYCIPEFFSDISQYVKPAVQRLSIILLVIFLTRSLMILLDIADELYRKREQAETRPIKGYLQLGKILLIIVAAILII